MCYRCTGEPWREKEKGRKTKAEDECTNRGLDTDSDSGC
jgi:hypothetical protein